MAPTYLRVCIRVCLYVRDSIHKWSGRWSASQQIAGLIPTQLRQFHVVVLVGKQIHNCPCIT